MNLITLFVLMTAGLTGGIVFALIIGPLILFGAQHIAGPLGRKLHRWLALAAATGQSTPVSRAAMSVRHALHVLQHRRNYRAIQKAVSRATKDLDPWIKVDAASHFTALVLERCEITTVYKRRLSSRSSSLLMKWLSIYLWPL